MPSTTTSSAVFSLSSLLLNLLTLSYVSSAPVTTAAGGSFTGDLTYYTPGLGACGETSTSSEAVVALAPEHFTDDSICGSTITINKDGQSTKATVVDKCMGCDAGSIDVSTDVFTQLAELSEGRVEVTWEFD